MKTQILSTLLGAALVVSVPAWAGDKKDKDKDPTLSSSAAQTGTGSQTGAYGQSRDKDATHGTVKEYKAGDKITINVPNGLDKNYDLNDTNTRVSVAAGVKEGDAVSVTESEQGGMKMVRIDRHGDAASASGMASSTPSSGSTSGAYGTSSTPSSSASGAYGTQSSQSSSTSSSSQSASGTASQSGSSSTMAGGQVTFGKVKSLKTGDEIVVDISNGDDKTFDLKQAELVTVAAGLKEGDSVKVTEWDQSGKKMVRIESQDSATAGTGSSDPSSPRTDEPEKKDKPKNP